MKANIKLLFVLSLILFSGHALADVKLPHIFSDNMVLQRDEPLKVWGWADRNETVQVIFRGKTQKAKANKTGYWSLQLELSAYGGLYGDAEEVYLKVGTKKYPLAGQWSYKLGVSKNQFNFLDVSPNMHYAMLYNAMINPIIQYSIKGAIWYQGENNAANAYNYRTLFPAMINDWRSKWGYDFPFYWVQLTNQMAKEDTPKESNWAELREAQTMTLALPKTGQAVITDIGDADDIHPRNKQDVGLRLALIALNQDYGRKEVVCSGPVYKSMVINGNQAVISFNNAENGLVVNSRYGYVEGFAIAGSDKKFHWAKAYADGDKVVVYSDEVNNPVAVRYSWANNPDVNLYNESGLPAAPFRTDKWRGITQYDNE